MTAAAILSQIEQLDRARAALMERLRAVLAGSSATVPDEPPVYISPSQATDFCGRSESQVRKDCELNPTDQGGFGLKVCGRWLVDRDRYIAMRGHARFRR
jgi:hypothetical protein